jgi:hypothetical protein
VLVPLYYSFLREKRKKERNRCVEEYEANKETRERKKG